MKCIKMCGLNNKVELKKVSNEEADKLVDAGKAVYIPKHLYKEAHGKGPAFTAPSNGSKSSNKQKNKAAKEELK